MSFFRFEQDHFRIEYVAFIHTRGNSKAINKGYPLSLLRIGSGMHVQ